MITERIDVLNSRQVSPPRPSPALPIGLKATLVLLGCLTLAPATFGGTLFSTLAYDGFRLQFEESGAAVVAEVDWTLPWYGEIDALAVDATPASRVSGLEIEGNNIAYAVDVESPMALSFASYAIADGDQVGVAADAGVFGVADTQISLGIEDGWAYGYAGSYFENRFRAIGGSAGEPLNLAFELAWSREWQVETPADTGSWELLNRLFLALYDPAADAMLAETLLEVAHSGIGSASLGEATAGTLEVGTRLAYGQDYILYGAADVWVMVPSPTPIFLMLAGLIRLRLRCRRDQRHSF